MLENYSARRGINVPLISFVSRRLVHGYKGEIAKIIGDQLGVRVTTRAGERPDQKSYMNIKGVSIPRVEAARDLLTQLDQKAKLIADDNILRSRADVTKLHWDMVKVHLPLLLETAQKNLPLVTLEDSPQAIAEAFTPPPVKQAPAPEVVAETSGEWKPKPRVLTIQFHEAAFVPRNLSQAIIYLATKDPTNSYVYGAGPFGGGKTFALLRAAFEAYNQKRVDEILLIRPGTSTGKDPGAMPGDARRKQDPYLKGGFASNIEKMTKTKMQELENKKVIRVFTPDFEIGETYDHAFIVIDEPQNLTVRQAELLIGRLGEGSIMAFSGDIGGKQTDLKGQMSGLAHLIATQGSAALKDKILAGATAFIEFKDGDSAARNKILPHVSAALNNPDEEYKALMDEMINAQTHSRMAKAIEGGRTYAVDKLHKNALTTAFRYEKQVQAQFPALYADNRELFRQERPQLKVA